MIEDEDTFPQSKRDFIIKEILGPVWDKLEFVRFYNYHTACLIRLKNPSVHMDVSLRKEGGARLDFEISIAVKLNRHLTNYENSVEALDGAQRYTFDLSDPKSIPRIHDKLKKLIHFWRNSSLVNSLNSELWRNA